MPGSSSSSATARLLRSAQSRLWTRRILKSGVRVGFVIGLFLVTLGALRFARGVPPFSWELLAAALGAAVFATGWIVSAVRPSEREAAAELDGLCPGAADRFSTWVNATRQVVDDRWRRAMTNEIDRFSASVSLQVPVEFLGWRRSAGVVTSVFVAGLAMQMAFRHQMQQSAAPRAVTAEILESSARELSVEPAADEIVRELMADATALRETRVSEPRDAAVRSLAAAAAAVRARAANAGKSAAEPSDRPGSEKATGRPETTTPAGITMDARVGTTGLSQSAPPDALARRLERLAKRLDERKREAAGLGQAAGQSADSNGSAGDSLLAELGKPGSSTAAGEGESSLPFGGPGSDRDVGKAGSTSQVDPLAETSGPELKVAAPPSESGSAVGFSVVSADSLFELQTPKRIGPVVPLEFSERALEVEEIPVGARDLVRRYFERLNAASE